MGRPVTDDERASIKDGHAAGKSLNAIAKDLGRPASTVASVAAKQGITFDRSSTEKATQAKVRDNRARRAGLISALYDIAEDEVAYLRQVGPYALTEVSAGQAVDYLIARLPAQDRRALVSSIAAAAQSAIRLEQVDSDEQGLPAVDAWLRTMLDRGE